MKPTKEKTMMLSYRQLQPKPRSMWAIVADYLRGCGIMEG
jgi:hypothetical protein